MAHPIKLFGFDWLEGKGRRARERGFPFFYVFLPSIYVKGAFREVLPKYRSPEKSDHYSTAVATAGSPRGAEPGAILFESPQRPRKNPHNNAAIAAVFPAGALANRPDIHDLVTRLVTLFWGAVLRDEDSRRPTLELRGVR
jgi:hypothetical protein